jgi:hypothetical protein
MIPAIYHGINVNNATFNNLSLSSSTSALEVIFQALTTDPITHVGFRLASITGTTPSYVASIQGVNSAGTAIGFPDGTIKGGGSPASHVFSPSSLGLASSAFHWIALDNSYTPSVGEFLAAVIGYSSGTVNGSNFASVSEVLTSRNSAFSSLPRVVINSSGSRTHRNGPFCGGWRTANHRFGSLPLASVSTASPTTTLEVGLKFTLPSWIGTVKLYGIQFNWAFGGTPGGGIEVAVYSGGGASDTTQATTQQHARYMTSANVPINLMFASPQTLSGGSTYRVSSKMLASTGGVICTADVTDSSDWQMLPSAPWTMSYTSRSGGDWTDVATRRPDINLLLGSVTAPSSGGGVRMVNVRGGADQ